MRLTGMTYRCDQCRREEHGESQVLNWLSVRLVRSKVAPMCGGAFWRRDFCSRECLAEWANQSPPEKSRPPHPMDAGCTDVDAKRCIAYLKRAIEYLGGNDDTEE